MAVTLRERCICTRGVGGGGRRGRETGEIVFCKGDSKVRIVRVGICSDISSTIKHVISFYTSFKREIERLFVYIKNKKGAPIPHWYYSIHVWILGARVLVTY